MAPDSPEPLELPKACARSSPSEGGAVYMFELARRAESFRMVSESEVAAERATADLCVAALSGFADLEGWFVPPLGEEIHGLRAVSDDRVFVARRKRKRPEVLAAHLGRPDALFSGFGVRLRLRAGWNRLELQFKDGGRRWRGFARCAIHLAPGWWLPWHWCQKGIASLGAQASHPEWNRRHGDASSAELEAMRTCLASFARKPKISVLMPAHDPDPRWLNRAIESVRNQVYPEWELCIADDASKRQDVRALLEEWAQRDERIQLRRLDENAHICRASNAALELCTGEFVALLDHDDELPPHALFHVAWEILEDPETAVIYSDEDKIGEDGRRSGPYFKSGWNYELLLGQNYISHLGAYRTELIREIGGFRPGYEGSQDWDLVLRAAARCGAGKVRHIPRILYHWRTVPGSAASGRHAKPYAIDAGRRAVEDHLRECRAGATLRTLDGNPDAWQVIWPLPSPPPLVSLVFAEPGPAGAFVRSLQSLRTPQAYAGGIEAIAVATGDELPALCKAAEAAGIGNLQFVECDARSGHAARCNAGAEAAGGEVLIFVDAGLEASTGDWLRELTSQALRADVGAVGGCLMLDDGSIVHAGFVLHLAGLIGHAFRCSPAEAPSAGGPPNLAREVTAVSQAALAIRRELFTDAGGFDSGESPGIYHDVDLCLRLREHGLRNVFTPFARLTYFGTSRQPARFLEPDRDQIHAATRRLVARWPQEFGRDAFFNPNLSLHSEIPVPTAPRISWPWQGSCGGSETGDAKDAATRSD